MVACNTSFVPVVNAIRMPVWPEFYEPPSIKHLPTAVRKQYEHRQKVFLDRVRSTLNQTSQFTAVHRRVLGPNVTILASVNGYNHTEVIAALLESGLRFHGLTTGGKKWGKLATFLTKFRALQHQVRLSLPYMIMLEEDVQPIPQRWNVMMDYACAWYDRHPQVDVLQLSRYSEVVLTSLKGARNLLRVVRRFGISKSDDQQLLNAHVMGTPKDWPTHTTKHIFPKPAGPLPKGYSLARMTNAASGHIFRTRKVTWAEMALLRLLTDPSRTETQSLPWYGNPEGFDLWDARL